MEGQYSKCCIIMSAQNVMQDSSLMSGTEQFNTCLKCFLRTVCSLAVLLLLLSVGLPVANAPDVLQPCGLLYYP
jgi:hypothetical protein